MASLIALYLNKPLTDIDSFISKKMYGVGYTKNTKECINDFEKIKKALIVDDSIISGKSMNQAKEKLKDINIELIYYVAYATKNTSNMIDIYAKLIENPRVFEWNFIHHNNLINACTDMDGVLCVDPTEEENDDGKKYRYFLLNAKPKYIPTRKVGYIVTSRLEKYRAETEEWLRKYNVSYNKLIMMNVATAKERQALGNHAEYKAEIFKKLDDAYYFIESDANQAKKISEITGKHVFCINNEEFYKESLKNRIKNKLKNKIKKSPLYAVLNRLRGSKR